MSKYPSSNQGSTASTGNPVRGIFDHIPNLIFEMITSEMRIAEPLDLDCYSSQAEKVRILKDIAAKCNNFAAKLKYQIGFAKSEEDNLKPIQPNENPTRCMKKLTTSDSFPSAIVSSSSQDISEIIPKRIKDITLAEISLEKNALDINSLPSTTRSSSSQDISKIIPHRIKDIMLDVISWKNNALDINTLESFFHKARNKRDVYSVARSLKIPIPRLKKQLKEIQTRCVNNPSLSNKKEKNFVKRLETIIDNLNRPKIMTKIPLRPSLNAPKRRSRK